MKKFIKIFAISFICLCGALTITSCRKHKHNVNESEWTKDSAAHWHACDGCDELFDLDLHTFSEYKKEASECKLTRACTICGYVATKDADHTWGAWAERTDGTLGRECTHCHKDESLALYYIKGQVAGNANITTSASEAGKLSVDANTLAASITLDLAVGDKFKVGTKNGSEFKAANITLPEGLEGTDDVEVKVAGEYEVKVTGLDTDKHTCTITLIKAVDLPSEGGEDQPTQGGEDQPTQGDEEVTSYTITYVTNGYGDQPAQVTEATALPAELPVLEATGYTFDGWFTDVQCTVAAVAGQAITANTTLYAKWTQEAVQPEPETKYDVTFNINGHGTQPAALNDVNALPAELPSLTETGYIFGGWYTDAECTVAAVAGQAITADTTLHAKWTQEAVQPEPETKYDVIFNINGHGTQPAALNDVNALPAELPTLTETGYIFGGWYTDAEFTVAAVAEQAITADTTLYAKWTLCTEHDVEVTSTESKCTVCGVSYVNYYLRGTVNNWSSVEKYLLNVDFDTKTATIVVTLKVNDDFKLALYEGWDTTYGYWAFFGSNEDANFKTIATGDGGDNMICKVAGTYKITVTYGTELSFVITKENHTHTKDNNAEWLNDANNHWYACNSCVDGTFELAAHDYETEWTVTDEEHFYKCKNCEAVKDKAAHIPDIPAATEEAGQYCTECDKLLAAQLNHKHVYDQKVEDKKFIVSAATCTSYAVYNYSCKCGGKGTETFEGNVYGEHAYGDLVPAVSVKCEEAGKASYYECGVCHKLFNESKVEVQEQNLVISAKGHDEELTHHEAVPSTHTEAGTVEYYTCESCKTNFSDAEGTTKITDLEDPADGHDEELEVVAAVASTCTENGNIKYYACSCGMLFADENAETSIKLEDTVLKASHSLAYKIEYTEPGEVNGQTKDIAKEKVYCTKCDAVAEYFYIRGNAVGSWDIVDSNRFIVDPTNLNVQYITVTLEANAEFKMTLGPTYDNYNIHYFQVKSFADFTGADTTDNNSNIKVVNAGTYTFILTKTEGKFEYTLTYKKHTSTCTTHTLNEKYIICADNHFKYCTNCKALVTEEHNAVIDVAVAPECGKDGLKEGSHCGVCGYIIKAQEVDPALQHKYTAEIATEQYFASAATCTTLAKYYKSCEYCGHAGTATFEAGELAKHVYNQEKAESKHLSTPADCLNAAVYYKSCVCGKNGTETFVNGEPLGHDYVDHEAKAPTCENVGYEAYQTCGRENCNYTTYNELPATDHNYKYKESLSNGKHVMECINDNCDSECEEDCKFGDWEVTLQPGEFTEGEQERECEVCHYVEKDTIAQQHTCVFSEEYRVEKEATCENTGLKYQYCTTSEKCKERKDEQKIPAVGHNWNPVSYDWADDNLSCTATKTCNNSTDCTITETKDSNVTSTATCTEAGQNTYTVIFETEGFESKTNTTVQAALGHNWNDVSYVWTEDNSSCTATVTCKRSEACTITETKDSTITTTATCETDGVKTFTVDFDAADLKIATEELFHGKLGHNFVTYKISWTSDFKCSATAECENDNCSQTETKNAEVTSSSTKEVTCLENGETVHTATFTEAGLNLEGSLTKTQTITAKGSHTWGNANTAAVYITKKCSNCDAEDVTTKIYFLPSKDWVSDEAKFGVHLYDGGSNADADLMMSDTNKDGIYEVSISGKYNKVNFVRLAANATAFNWTLKWNQSGDISLPTTGTNNLCKQNQIWDAWTGSWVNESNFDKATIDYKVVHLIPSSSWKVNNSRYAVYCFNDSGNTWVDMVDKNGDGTYSAVINTTYNNIIFCHMWGDNSNNDWATKRNQTADLTLPTNDKITYNVTNSKWS